MRLYLSSFNLGNHSNELLKLLNSSSKIAIINNGIDFVSDNDRAKHLQTQINNLSAIGLLPQEIDLRQYFGNPTELQLALDKFDSVWVRGGNVFILKRAFELSGFDNIIIKRVKENSLVYAGYSAGSVIMAPTLHGIDLVDNPQQIPTGYTESFSWNGLNLVPYSIAPHYKSDHSESSKIDEVITYFQQNNMPYKALRDGEVIVVNESTEKVLF